MKEKIHYHLGKARKTTISTLFSTILVYCLGKGYIAPEEANLISGLFLTLGISINLITKRNDTRK